MSFKKLVQDFAKSPAGQKFAEAAAKAQADIANAAIDALEGQLPASVIENLVNELNDRVSGPQVSQAIAAKIQGLDLSKIEDSLNGIVGTLQDPQQNRQLATELHKLAGQEGAGDALMAQLDAVLSKGNVPPQADAVLRQAVGALAGYVDSARGKSVDEISQDIANFGGQIPVDLITAQVYGTLQQLDTQTIGALLQNATRAIPTGQQAGAVYSALLQNARAKVTGPKPPKPPKGGGNGGFSL